MIKDDGPAPFGSDGEEIGLSGNQGNGLGTVIGAGAIGDQIIVIGVAADGIKLNVEVIATIMGAYDAPDFRGSAVESRGQAL